MYDDSLKSSKADKGRGCCLGIVSRAPTGCRILGLTISMRYRTSVPNCNVRSLGLLVRALSTGPYQKNSGKAQAIIMLGCRVNDRVRSSGLKRNRPIKPVDGYPP